VHFLPPVSREALLLLLVRAITFAHSVRNSGRGLIQPFGRPVFPAAMSIEVVDLDLDASLPRTDERRLPSAAELRQAIGQLLCGRDLAGFSLKTLRRELEGHFNLAQGGLDDERNNIKTFAQEVVQSQQCDSSAVAAKAVPTNGAVLPAIAERAASVGKPAGNKRSSLLVAASPRAPKQARTVAIDSSENGGEQCETDTKEKVKRPASAYMLYSSAHRARITEELTRAAGGAKQSFGAIAGAVAQAWKDATESEKAFFKEKEAAAKAEFASSHPAQLIKPKALGRGRGRGGRGQGSGDGVRRGGGRGRGRGDAATDIVVDTMTRTDFLRAKQSLSFTFNGFPGPANAPSASPREFVIPARLFKTGSVGWFLCMEKMRLTIGGRTIVVGGQINLTVVNSKCWEDGEGFQEVVEAAAMANAASGADAAGDIAEGGTASMSQSCEMTAPSVDAQTSDPASKTPNDADTAESHS